jgi:fatty-acid peroxygenase
VSDATSLGIDVGMTATATDVSTSTTRGPRFAQLDRSLALLIEGYDFGVKRFERWDTDAFDTRLLLQRAVVMRGAEAARRFYDESMFRRAGTMPRRMRRTLIGEDGVQTLDGDAHRERKAMFMSLMTPESIQQLIEHADGEWQRAIEQWSRSDEVELFSAVNELLCRAVCAWVGVDLPDGEVAERTRQMEALIDSPAALGPRHWRGRIARRATERWIGPMVAEAGGGERPIDVVARHVREHDLDVNVGAVEVLNLIRPTVAVGRYITFAALAVHSHPALRDRLLHDDEFVANFVLEVRRTTPFFPIIAAETRDRFQWNGIDVPEGTLVVLDLHATDLDPARWKDPHRFDPDRHAERPPGAFDLIPQGGGDFWTGHRCAGEWITNGLMEQAVRFLVREMVYDLEPQDLRVPLGKIPTLPRSGLRITGVGPTGTSNGVT